MKPINKGSSCTWKKIMKTDLSTGRLVLGSIISCSMSAKRTKTLPLDTRQSSRSKVTTRDRSITPAVMLNFILRYPSSVRESIKFDSSTSKGSIQLLTLLNEMTRGQHK